MTISNTTIARRLAAATCLLVLIAVSVSASAGGAAGQEKSSQPVVYDQMPLTELQRLAEKGNAAAQFELGSRHNYGRGVPKNIREALQWLRRAAQAGQQDAMRLLAVKFYGGFEVPEDHDEAFKWAYALADGGDRQGQVMLGNMYGNGEGVQRSLVRAYMWYDIAATLRAGEEPDAEADKLMQDAADKRDMTVKLLLPAQEAEAQQLASAWWAARNKAPQKKKSR